MNIGDPKPRLTADSIPRSGSAMSFRSAPPSAIASKGPGLPPAPNYGLPYRHQTHDTLSMNSRNSNPEAGEFDVVSMYSYHSDSDPYYANHEQPPYDPNYQYDPSMYQHQGYDPGMQHHHLPYDQPQHPPYQQPGQPPYYNAASSVLGMGPPPHHPGGGPPGPSYMDPSTSNYHSPGPGGAPPQPQQGIPPQQYYDQQSISSVDQDTDFVTRPPMPHTETTSNLRSQRSKAVDLNAPPFTKEFIDQYRQRIKADPDPESHFKYARYLIEAAKRVGSEAKDQRAVKKYRDLLIAEALKVVRRLATQGEVYDEAQFFLANCYGTGMLGLQVDHERAYHLYLQAAKQNHAAACYRVAVCNEIGAGTRREPPRAAAFYRKAASLGDTAAMYKLGMILLNGTLGEAQNPREAINWLKRAAEQADTENPHALHELALLYENPGSQIVPYDPIYARNLYTQAAQLGYTQSQFRLGQCFEYGSLTCPVDPRRSIAWYTKAAEKGNSEAELALSGWYLTGSEGVLKQSDSEAYLWARRAANKGLAKAEYAVGYYAEVGIGIKQDIDFAKRWYMRAAAQGNKRAMNRLTEMKRMGNKRVPMSRPTRQQAGDECVIS
jgi:TPR repeat protein